MLEIVILYILAGKIGKIVEAKGRKKIGYQLMLIGMWFGGEFLGIFAGAIAAAVLGNEDGAMLIGVFAGLGCAIVAAVIAFQIAKNLQPLGDADDEFYRGVEYADGLGATERFRERGRVPPPEADGYTDRAEKARRPLDDRIQE